MRFAKLTGVVLAVMTVPLLALAGGWALTTFDELPESFVAGETYELSYTILQHGKTPVDVGPSSILITDFAGTTTEFEAARSKGVGRYTVDISLPAEGSFTWQVTQGGFAPHEMGSFEVTSSVGAAAPIASFLLPAAFALVVGLLALQVFAMVRRRPSAVRAD